MKKMLAVLIIVLLSGCANKNFDNRIDTIEQKLEESNKQHELTKEELETHYAAFGVLYEYIIKNNEMIMLFHGDENETDI